jgi:hypothetical protein
MSFAADMNDRGVLDFPKADTHERQQGISAIRRVRCRAIKSTGALRREPGACAGNSVQY